MTVQFAAGRGDAPRRKHLRAWAKAALERDAEVTVRVVEAEEGRALNREYRGKDYPTNVLTFVYAQYPACQGDLVLCAPLVRDEAAAQGKDLAAHYAHLVVHGMLHLQGYDHEAEDQAAAMEAVESHIVKKLGYPDPYAGDA